MLAIAAGAGTFSATAAAAARHTAATAVPRTVSVHAVLTSAVGSFARAVATTSGDLVSQTENADATAAALSSSP